MNSIITLFGNKKLISIIAFFIEIPSIEITQSELIKKTKLSKATAIKWTNYLIKNNYLLLKKVSNLKLLKLNNDNIIIKELKKINILLKINFIEKYINKDIEIYLYGSCARGEYKELSDIDLLIIGKIKKHELIDQIDKISKIVNRKVNFKIFTPLEWSKLSKQDRAFYERVEKDKLQIK
ncbi:nucleotidyltransferase domain-containing protein [Candidatus Woesearchaeota archaeon]|nr:nucleotidyltransferase domain-containing protein [Candidatus Woesearchaeota archaeon]